MAKITVFHNPACSSSRGALELLKSRNVDFEIIEYLKTPPDRATLEKILDRIDSPPSVMVRTDRRFKDLKLKPDDYRDRDSVIGLLLQHPELMQRPVVINEPRAVIARPPEKLLAIL